jgi:hypothetical protein
MTLIEQLDRFPPCLCRLLAQCDDELMTDRKLIEITGWSKQKLERISSATSWSMIYVRDVVLFLYACGLDGEMRRRRLWLLKVATKKGEPGLRRMRHLRSARKQDVTVLLKRTERVLQNNQ